MTRPSLITIGNNVDINKHFQILTHDYANFVFVHKYHEFINSSGAVNIGSNIYFGTNVTILKGVTIGDNCVIAAGSIVTKDIPSGSVAAGIPCKVICSIDEYFEKRKKNCLSEAVEYVNSIIARYGRDPYPEEFYEEFIWFVDKSNYEIYKKIIPIDRQLGCVKDDYLINHKARFGSLEEFVDYCKQKNKEECDN